MKVKYITLFSAIIISLLTACKEKGDQHSGPIIPVTSQVDFDKGAVQIMDSIAPKILGKWKISQIEFDINNTNPTGSVKKDTIFKDFAIIEVNSISRQEDPRNIVCKASVIHDDTSYPVTFRINAYPASIVEKAGPQAFTLLEWNFPAGGHSWQQNEIFFRDLSLVQETYTIEFDYLHNSMVWKGLNRDVKEMKMVRR